MHPHIISLDDIRRFNKSYISFGQQIVIKEDKNLNSTMKEPIYDLFIRING
jgi:hypothetical protein